MKKTSTVITLVAALMLVTGVAAFAGTNDQPDPKGTKVAASSALVSFFTARGVDAQYIGMDASEIPADQLKLINSIIATQDDTDNAVYTHTTLNKLVLGALSSAATSEYVPYYIQIGTGRWSMEIGSSLLPDGETANPSYVGL
jgi:hypothetical protein